MLRFAIIFAFLIARPTFAATLTATLAESMERLGEVIRISLFVNSSAFQE